MRSPSLLGPARHSLGRDGAAESAVLLQHVPADQLDGFDQHQRLYGAPADRFGLRREADAVCAEAWRIWRGFDRPLPWDLPDDLWTRRC